MSKKVKIIVFSLAALILLFVAGVLVKATLDRRRLMAVGIRTDGRVLELFERSSRSRRSSSTTYYAKVGLFLRDSTTPEPSAVASHNGSERPGYYSRPTGGSEICGGSAG